MRDHWIYRETSRGQNWKTGEPLHFIAQINFSEISKFDTQSELPSRGMLYLFYDCAGMPWGYDPKDGAFKKVIYAEDTSELERKVAPFENNEAFAATSLKFANTTELPDLESDLVGDIEMSDDEIDAYWQMADDFCEQRSENKILGHSDNIQGGMELECELVTAFIAAAMRIIAGWSLKNFGKISASGRCYYKSAVTTKTR